MGCGGGDIERKAWPFLLPNYIGISIFFLRFLAIYLTEGEKEYAQEGEGQRTTKKKAPS